MVRPAYQRRIDIIVHVYAAFACVVTAAPCSMVTALAGTSAQTPSPQWGLGHADGSRKRIISVVWARVSGLAAEKLLGGRAGLPSVRAGEAITSSIAWLLVRVSETRGIATQRSREWQSCAWPCAPRRQHFQIQDSRYTTVPKKGPISSEIAHVADTLCSTQSLVIIGMTPHDTS